MKKGPARIRVTLSRPLSHSELEWLREACKQRFHGKTISAEFNGSTYRVSALPFRVRLSEAGRLYAESHENDSRLLYSRLTHWIENSFVNVHPIAVRTFRELQK